MLPDGESTPNARRRPFRPSPPAAASRRWPVPNGQRVTGNGQRVMGNGQRARTRSYTPLMSAARLALTMDPLDIAGVTKAVLDTASAPTGAVASFIGLVRGENLGR